ncbi:MAG TPA: hypothetical protein QGF58_21480 [Myxococcota bacterium]|nr:hypothetical protein [Myxococcota bacterium]
MEIERLWGKEPGWFYSQPAEGRLRLMAWYSIRLDPQGKARRRRSAVADPDGFWGSP